MNQSISTATSNTFLQRVFLVMSIGLVITGLTSFLFGSMMLESEAYRAILYNLDPFGHIVGMSGLGLAVAIAPFAFILVLGFGINKLSVSAASAIFGLFAMVMGFSLSSIFLVYPGTSIALTFFVTAGTFGAMALIGMTTKLDLAKLGSILIMALLGVMIALVVNIFVGSSVMQMVISIIGVILFCALTAYDTQRLLKESKGLSGSNDSIAQKEAVLGALTLYLDFINLFNFILSLMGAQRK